MIFLGFVIMGKALFFEGVTPNYKVDFYVLRIYTTCINLHNIKKKKKTKMFNAI